MQKLFYIDYPQEHFEGHSHRYRCAFCKEETTKINGRIQGHLHDWQYSNQLEQSDFEPQKIEAQSVFVSTDYFD